MRKKGSERFSRSCFFAVLLFLISSAFAQNAVLNRKKPPRQSSHVGVLTPATDTTIARQPLFSILKQLNQSKGIFFLFSDKSFGEIQVRSIADYNRPVEKILDELLQFTGLKFKKINEKTFLKKSFRAFFPHTQILKHKPAWSYFFLIRISLSNFSTS